MTTEKQRNRWQQFHLFQAKMERKWRPKVAKAIGAQVNQFLDYAKQHSFPFAIMDINTAITIEPIGTVIQDIYRDAGVRWGYITYREFNRLKRMLSGDIQSSLLDFIENYFQTFLLDKSVLPITETVRNWIKGHIENGLAAGSSYEQIANEMSLSGWPQAHALTVVRTETVRAANAGSVEGARQTGLMVNKIWISAKDNRTRRIPRDSADHLHLDTQKVAMDGTFTVHTKKHGDVQMAHPGDPVAPAECVINCRCCTGFEPVRDNRGRSMRALSP